MNSCLFHMEAPPDHASTPEASFRLPLFYPLNTLFYSMLPSVSMMKWMWRDHE